MFSTSAPRALLFTTIQGHASIADSISRKLTERGWHTLTAAFEDPGLAVYRWIYRYAPKLCRIYYNAIFLPQIRSLIAFYTKKSHRKVFQKALADFPTDVIIGTSYGFDSSVLELRRTLRKEGKPVPKFINIVVDPRTFFATNLVEEADVNCVFDEEIARRCRKFRPKAVVEPTGWFVRPEFNSRISKAAIRKELGLDPDRLTLLFVAGSEGETKSAQLIPPLLALGVPIQIILACGSNQKLRDSFQPIVERYAHHPDQTFITLPFTKELYKYVRAADLLVGKAGPNSIFEAAACGTPFFATTHIAGQEDGNLEIIQEFKLGYVEEDLSKAAKLLEQIVAMPEQLEQFNDSLKAMAAYNDRAIDRLLEVLSHSRNTLTRSLSSNLN